MPQTLRSRGAALRLLVLVTLVVALAGCGAVGRTPPVASAPGGVRDGTAQRFFSAPGLRPAWVTVDRHAKNTDAGYVFAAPRPDRQAAGGPMMFDSSGHLVWFHPVPAGHQAISFEQEHYNGKPVLVWGERPVNAHEGSFFVILDSSYRSIAHVHAGEGDGTDLHDFQITPRHTALVIGYRFVPYNLSKVGGPSRGQVLDGTIQEVSIPTGRVLWRWSALAHIPVSESQAHVPQTGPYDAYHLNSVSEDADGNILVSARHTSTLYKISRKTGRILWRLGTRRSNFKLSKAAGFAFQHDARWGSESTITLFNNGATDTTRIFKQSSGRRLRVNYAKHTVTLAQQFTHSPPFLSESQGDFQPLPHGHGFIGWGKAAFASEFDSRGAMVWQAHFPSGRQQSYTARRFGWTGTPTNPPDVVAYRRKGGVTLQASWNGATGVRSWEILAGPGPQKLKPIGTVPRRGFETVLRAKTRARWFAVRALGSAGQVLRTSRALSPH